MKKIGYSFLFTACILLGSCRHENLQEYPEEFSPLVDEFFYQANQRGLPLNPTHYDFSIRFGDTADDVGGICNTINGDIIISEEDWQHRNDFDKELILFHELGHCILHRNHRNSETSTNECFSYMRADDDCYVNNYSVLWRDYYLDELFREDTPLPEWFLSNQEYKFGNIAFTDSVVINDTIIENDILEIESFRFSQKDTFLFEIEFKNTDPSLQGVSFSIGNLRFYHCGKCTSINTNLQIGNNRIHETMALIINEDMKLTVFRNNDIVSFYVNEYFVHAMEYSLIEGNRLRTFTYEGKINMGIRYLFN